MPPAKIKEPINAGRTIRATEFTDKIISQSPVTVRQPSPPPRSPRAPAVPSFNALGAPTPPERAIPCHRPAAGHCSEAGQDVAAGTAGGASRGQSRARVRPERAPPAARHSSHPPLPCEAGVLRRSRAWRWLAADAESRKQGGQWTSSSEAGCSWAAFSACITDFAGQLHRAVRWWVNCSAAVGQMQLRAGRLDIKTGRESRPACRTASRSIQRVTDTALDSYGAPPLAYRFFLYKNIPLFSKTRKLKPKTLKNTPIPYTFYPKPEIYFKKSGIFLEKKF
jgi:hypothetical protein